MAGLKAPSSPATSSLPKDSDELDHFGSQPDENDSKSRRHSGYTAISSIPASLPADDIPYVARKHRPAFRSPSSVRALQLSSPSPLGSPRASRNAERRQWSQSAVKRFSADCESDTDSLGDDGEMLRRLMAQEQDGQPKLFRTASDVTATSPYAQPQAPLILLHVSILPCPMPQYSHAVLHAHAPKYVIDNYHLLQEKLSDVLCTRGCLIPHPGEEYDVLEERLLEALELCAPRVLGCGHFFSDSMDNLSEDEQSDKTATNDEDSLIEDEGPRAICDYAHEEKEVERSASSDSLRESDHVCNTCERPMRLPYRGVGHGNARWNVNFYAANGLMRAGAWSAAWREMERVDVEIAPWMPDAVKRALEKADHDEHEAAMGEKRQQQLQLELLNVDLKAAGQKIHQLEEDLLRVQEEAQRTKLAAMAQSQSQPVTKKPEIPAPDELRMAKGSIPPTKGHLGGDIPLNRLVLNYIWILAQDKRNLALGALSVLLLFMSIMLTGSTAANMSNQAISSQLPTAVPQILASAPRSIASFAVQQHQLPRLAEKAASFTSASSISLITSASVQKPTISLAT